jgi:transglutaminase superfamily protein
MHAALLSVVLAVPFPQSSPPEGDAKAPLAIAARSSRGADSDGDGDGDGLGDFDELHKYLTDPARADSDGDGIPDGEWDERREYAYTIRSVVDVCPPVTEEFLCDDFQDARVLGRAADHVRLEVIHYPFSTAQAEIAPDPDWRAHVAARDDLKVWLAPGPTADFDDAMRSALLAALAEEGIDALRLDDKTLVEKTSRWLLDHTRFEDGFTTYTATFRDGKAAVLPELKERVDSDLKALGRSLDEQWSRELFAKRMFEQRVHGTCTSSAILWSGVFRALGIPTRIVLMMPVVDSSDPEEVGWLATKLENHRVSALLRDAIPPRSGWTNHTFDEVFVGGRWRRLNYVKLGQGILDANCLGLMTHVATVSDWADGEFARTYGVLEMLHHAEKSVFGGSNPYSCAELSDRFGVHAPLDNPAVPTHEQLTIERLYWWSSPEREPTVDMKLDDPATAGHLLFHVAEGFLDQTSRQYSPFYEAVDHDFVLRADGHADVPAHATRGFWCEPRKETREFYLRVEPADVAKIESNIAYRLVAKNRKPGKQWVVAPGVTITRRSERDPFAAR